MRLLKRLPSGDFELVSINDDENPPPYAILSHTWTEGEVTYDEMEAGEGKDKTGYHKICFCGERAAADNLQYFWVDTCCINKSTSHELSSAINSMFRWYQRASKCYAYMSDVVVPEEVIDAKAFRITWLEAFQRSRWFQRGWTLQELLAPPYVEFFSKNGKSLGSKISLEQEIHEITGIATEALRGQSLAKFSVEERMSWAEKRTTTLKEDKVYCLLGIFGVFLSLIYGEGEKYATLRLEEEIQKRHPYPTTPATTTAASNPKRLRTVVFSPDGKLVLSASLDKTVCLWDVAREKKTPYRLEDCYIDSIGQVAFSPKDSLVALAPEDSTANTVILWDATSGEVLHLLKGHNDRVESVVFSPDGELLASSSSDKTAILWYTATGKVRWTLSGHKDKVRAVAFSPNRERPMIASASGDKTVRLWDVTTGESMQTLRGHVASVRAIVFSPNGELVASASEDKTVRIWNAKTSAAIQAPSNHTRCGDMGVLEYEQSQSGRLDAQRRAGDLCTRDQEGAALEGSHNLVAYTREPSQQRQGNQALDRQQTSTVCTLEQNSKAVVWGNKSSQPFTNRQIGTENIKGKNPMTLGYCPTNNVVNLEGSQQPNQRRPFSLERRVVSTPGQNGRPSRPDAQRAQRAQQSGRSKSSKDNAIFIFKAHKDKNKDRVNAVAFSPDNKVMASASVDGTILLWSASTGAVLVEFKCRPVSTLQFSKDGLYLQTDCGLLSIGSREASVNPQSSQQTNAILIKGNCIYRGEERVQLSPDDQPFCSAFRGNVLALGLPSGMVKFIKS